MIQECRDLGCTHVTVMTALMEAHKAANLVQIALLGAAAVVTASQVPIAAGTPSGATGALQLLDELCHVSASAHGELERVAAKFLVHSPSVSGCGDYRPGPIAASHSFGKQDHVTNSMPKRAVSRSASRTWMYSISRVSR